MIQFELIVTIKCGNIFAISLHLSHIGDCLWSLDSLTMSRKVHMIGIMRYNDCNHKDPSCMRHLHKNLVIYKLPQHAKKSVHEIYPLQHKCHLQIFPLHAKKNVNVFCLMHRTRLKWKFRSFEMKVCYTFEHECQ